MKYDRETDKFVVPFAEVDRSTLTSETKTHKYKGFISSQETRYGYSGLNCFNNLFHAMSFYRKVPHDRRETIFELALFERETYNQIILENLAKMWCKGGSNFQYIPA